MAKAKEEIPQTAEELTAAWFTSTVGARLGGATVTAVGDIANIGEGIGFLGSLFRCPLTWDRDSDGSGNTLPSSVIVKVPAPPGTNRASGETIQAYEREIVAYRDLGDDMGLPMPRFYYGAFDKNPAGWLIPILTFLFEKLPIAAVNWLLLKLLGLNGTIDRRYVLVMEDIDDARPPTQAEGGSLEDTEAALDILAQFHAHHWMRTDTVERDDIIWPIERTPKVWQCSFRRNRDEFAEQFSHIVSAEEMAQLDEIDERADDIVEQLGSAPWTLSHGDYRLDNILFRPDGSMVVLDYQGILRARPGFDVAYFITTALTGEHVAEEERLLRRYHEALVAAGVSDYPWEMLLSDAQATKELIAHRMVVTVDTLETDVEGRDESFVETLVGRVMAWL